MKRINYLVICAIFLMLGSSVDAQNARLKRGDNYYESLAYPLAIKSYEKGLKKERDLRSMERVADAYWKIGDTEGAERWYAELVKTKGSAPINKFYYGEVLKANGKYTQARTWFEAYLQTGENPKRAATFIESCDYAMQLKEDSSRYEIKPVDFNVGASDISPVVTRQGMVYSSSRKRGFGSRFINLRDREKNFYDIYLVERNTSKKGFKVKPLKGKVNTRFHEGPAVFTPKGDKLYFTRSNFVKGKAGEDTRGINRLKIYSATLKGNKWKNVEELPFNDDLYSCGHPTLSESGDMMVFASDIPGGFGGTDLYVSKYDGKTWSTPVNLGSAINSQGDEEFPYLDAEGTLFFSSDGLPGMGGLDIFAATAEGERWGSPVNAGYPMNSSKDDFGVAYNKGKPSGYFTSNRSGNDDIYTFKRKMMLKGTIVDSRTGKPLNNAEVTVMDINSRETKFRTDGDGTFSMLAEWGKDYFTTVDREDYLQLREKLETKSVGPLQDLVVTLPLERDMIFTLSGNVRDAANGKAITDATVRVISGSENKLKSDNKGAYFSELEEATEYTVIIMKEGYMPQIASVTTIGKQDPEDFVVNASLDRGRYMLVEGRTFKLEGRDPLSAVNVRSVDAENRKEVKATASRSDGRFWVLLNPEVEQFLIGSKQGYFAARADLPNPKDFKGDTTVTIELPMVPYEIGALVKVIYYDYDKSDITKVASKDLFEIVYFLEDNPEASVDLASHTDSRGSDKYNTDLSQTRSNAAVGYIVNRGIESARILAKGFGEKQLVNKCGDGVNCEESEHALNRRTEIRVTKLDLGKVDEPWKRQMILDQMVPQEAIVK